MAIRSSLPAGLLLTLLAVLWLARNSSEVPGSVTLRLLDVKAQRDAPNRITIHCTVAINNSTASKVRFKSNTGGWLDSFSLVIIAKDGGEMARESAGKRSSSMAQKWIELHRGDNIKGLPLLGYMVFVSAETGFNHHLRYILPVFPFFFIWISRVASPVFWRFWWVKGCTYEPSQLFWRRAKNSCW